MTRALACLTFRACILGGCLAHLLLLLIFVTGLGANGELIQLGLGPDRNVLIILAVCKRLVGHGNSLLGFGAGVEIGIAATGCLVKVGTVNFTTSLEMVSQLLSGGSARKLEHSNTGGISVLGGLGVLDPLDSNLISLHSLAISIKSTFVSFKEYRAKWMFIT